MRDTEIEVYSVARTNITITRSPLRAVIAGGLRRDVSRRESVTMDASLSVDPDFPNDRDLRWVFWYDGERWWGF